MFFSIPSASIKKSDSNAGLFNFSFAVEQAGVVGERH
jgi:hypothetical protein